MMLCRRYIMKFIRQFLIILFISFLGEALKYLLPLPIPASIYGLVLLFLALQFQIIQLSAVKDAANFLIDIMPLMFIPAGVGILESWDALQPVLFPVIVIILVSTVLVMAVSGKVTQGLMKFRKKRIGE